MEIFKEFRFEAAHSLPHLPEGHKCRNLHGHSYLVRVVVSGPVNEATGWVMDFADISRAFRPIFERLDHAFLNDLPGIGPSTTENLARWIWRELRPGVPLLARVEIWETPTSGCVYAGEG
jgi:6-pyruvoyltetrahydropterin/6-carboxytetrahydropterin synthase